MNSTSSFTIVEVHFGDNWQASSTEDAESDAAKPATSNTGKLHQHMIATAIAAVGCKHIHKTSSLVAQSPKQKNIEQPITKNNQE